MALQTIRLGSLTNILQYDDADYITAIEVDDPIRVNHVPVDDADVLRLEDMPGAATLITSGAVIADHAIVRGDGGARIVQDSSVIISDTGGITIPDGETIGSVTTPTAITIRGSGNLVIANKIGIGVVPGYVLHALGDSPTVFLDDTTNTCQVFL